MSTHVPLSVGAKMISYPGQGGRVYFILYAAITALKRLTTLCFMGCCVCVDVLCVLHNKLSIHLCDERRWQ